MHKKVYFAASQLIENSSCDAKENDNMRDFFHTWNKYTNSYLLAS